jgi:MerR family copper efflux transcriptional regulator
MERLLTIGELARATSVPAKTIRYYEQVGVLPAPRRSTSGYRQYTQRDVHRLLFIRRARALGLSLSSLTALAELADGSCLAMRPRLTYLVTEHLHTLRQQIAELQLLERQLTQVAYRLVTAPPSPHADGCQCLADDGPVAPEIPHLSLPHIDGGHDMNTSQTLESLTVLTTTPQGPCGCGCGCEDGWSRTQLIPLHPSSDQEEAVHEDASRRGGR